MLIGRQVTVIGGGIAGFAAARALALRGASVRVLEQAPALAEVGAGIQIGPNGAAVLRALGLGPAFEAASLRAQAVELRDGVSGRLVTRVDVGGGLAGAGAGAGTGGAGGAGLAGGVRSGLGGQGPEGGYRFVHRADLVELLHEGAVEAGVEVRFGHRADVRLAGPQPLVDGAPAGLLIGADGLQSQVRAALTGRVAPFFTHQVAWRALIPAEPGAPAVAEVHMGRGRHLVSYPLRGGALRNIVAVEERRDWVAEGWHQPDDPAAVRAAFAGFGPRVRGWLEAVREVHLWGLFRHPVAQVWQRGIGAGGVAILGDAAHPMLPFLAQGASMALEDAWVLADRLAGTDTAGAGLAAYQAARAGRCARVVAAADANARLYHLGGLARVAAHAGMRLVGAAAPDWPSRRFDWLYGVDVTR